MGAVGMRSSTAAGVGMFQTRTEGAVTKGAVDKRQICSEFAGFCFEPLLPVSKQLICVGLPTGCRVYLAQNRFLFFRSLQIRPNLAGFGQNWPDLQISILDNFAQI